MKYIRTKNTIFDLEELRLWNIPFMIVDDVIDFNSTGRHKIIDRADTIEDLCDEFVIDGIYGHQIIHSYKETKETKFECIREENYVEIYGAIWTDKGLIYVAKMNDKGELELL